MSDHSDIKLTEIMFLLSFSLSQVLLIYLSQCCALLTDGVWQLFGMLCALLSNHEDVNLQSLVYSDTALEVSELQWPHSHIRYLWRGWSKIRLASQR